MTPAEPPAASDTHAPSALAVLASPRGMISVLAYLAVFAGIAIAFLTPAVVYRLDQNWYIASAGLAVTLAVLSAIDLATFRLPDALTLPLIIAGLALSQIFGEPSLEWRALSAAAGFSVLALVAIVYRHLRQRDGLGLGDAKLFAAAGAWLGVEHLAMVLLVGSGTALLSVAVMALVKGTIDVNLRLAFGPFLAVGFWTVWIATATMA